MGEPEGKWGAAAPHQCGSPQSNENMHALHVDTDRATAPALAEERGGTHLPGRGALWLKGHVHKVGVVVQEREEGETISPAAFVCLLSRRAEQHLTLGPEGSGKPLGSTPIFTSKSLKPSAQQHRVPLGSRLSPFFFKIIVYFKVTVGV